MLSTRQKLEEAAFFLGKLRESYQSSKKFRSYLNAFLSASRSVTWVMNSEYHSNPDWKVWYDSVQPTKEEEKLLKTITNARNRSQKVGPLDIAPMAKVEFREAFPLELAEYLDKHKGDKIEIRITSNNDKYFFEFVVDGKSIMTNVISNINVWREIKEYPDEDALVVCERYYSWLEKLVHKCESRFSS